MLTGYGISNSETDAWARRGKSMKKSNTTPTKLIAPCGINCRLCRAYDREENSCPGCRGEDRLKPEYCVHCKIKTCDVAQDGEFKYCFECESYPCKRLRQLDRRYRSKYGMSMVETLGFVV